jgi:hypothetical protein
MSAGAVFAALVLLTASTTSAQKFTASPPPSPGNALLYIYRQGGMVGALGHPVLFVNDYLLAQLYTSNYAAMQVPQGSAAITATFAFQGKLVLPSPIGSWATLPGCVGLDWRRLAAAPPADITLCRDGLSALYTKCSPIVTFSGCALPGCVLTKTVHVPACFSDLSGSNDAPFLLDIAQQLPGALANGLPRPPTVNLRTQLRIEVESGKTYYVRWSVTTSGGKMILVDGPAAEKEIRKLNLAK